MLDEVWVKREKPPGGLSHLSARNPLEITYSGVHYWAHDGRRGMKEILKGLDGRMKPGELTAIMGPSGAGKTSLMNVLAGYRLKNVTGKVEVNGRERDLHVFRHLSTYIPQQDHVIPTLTVMESMLVAASLKLPSSVSYKGKLAAVEEILQLLGIQHCAKTKAWHLSGGEKKRLCIAMELVNNPPVLFLDEPTSKLDSFNCLQCVSLLRMLAHEGRTVICTIHHPSVKILEMFDHLIILNEGRCLYHGTISSMVPYLRQFGLHCPPYHNPADFADAHRRLCQAFGEGVISEKTCFDWFARFESGNYCVEDKPRSGRPSEFDDGALLQIVEADPRMTTRDMAAVLGCLVMDVAFGYNGRDAMNALFAAAKAEATTPSELEGPDPQTPPCLEGKPPPSFSVSGLWTKLKESVRRAETKPPSTPTAVAEYAVSFTMQVKTLYLRFNKTNSRDWILMHIRLGAHILVALFMGILFFKLGENATNVYYNVGSLFFSVLFVIYGAIMPTVITYPLEFNVLQKETLNKWYSLKAYHMAKMLSDIPFVGLCTSVYLVISYFMTAQPMDADRFLRYLVLTVYVALITQTLGFMIGTIFPIQYYYEGTMACIYGYNRQDLQCNEPYCHFKDPEMFLREMGLDEYFYWRDFWVLLLHNTVADTYVAAGPGSVGRANQVREPSNVAVSYDGREVMNTLFAAAKAEATLSSELEDLAPQTPVCLEGKPPPSAIILYETKLQSKEDAFAEYAVSFTMQVKCLYLRFNKTNFRDWILMYIRFGTHILVALFLGLLYFNVGDDATKIFGNFGSILVGILFVIYGSMMPTVITYPLEFLVLRKETLNKWYSLKAYHVAKMLSDIPFTALCTFVFLVICYFMIAQPMDASRFLKSVALGMHVAFISQSLGFIVGTLLPIQTAAFLSPVIIMPFLLFSGFLLRVKAIPGYLRWLSHLSFLKYYFEGTMASIYGYNRPDFQCNEPYCHFKKPYFILRETGLDDYFYWRNFWVLLLYNVILRLLAYFVLRWKLHRAR
ncbi:unnamed protein product [Darwinula stevensoni]|uniref:ABC transporter domain-containing protein n=1 Tax=Darwinula stevensoni TaxID=69355 RepID=A0A7R9A786_9CRUS|nr:unnamed protein product [Darwinula stevensoni]CAG0892107.1 unnamed protein product [Darwinula stevensoni]